MDVQSEFFISFLKVVDSLSNDSIQDNYKDSDENKNSIQIEKKIRGKNENNSKKLETVETSNYEIIKDPNNVCFYKCQPNTKYRKRNKGDTILNSYFSTVNNTKRSTNLSFKSIKLNDTLMKFRKKKLESKEKDLKIKQENKKTHCKCMIF